MMVYTLQAGGQEVKGKQAIKLLYEIIFSQIGKLSMVEIKADNQWKIIWDLTEPLFYRLISKYTYS